MRPSGTRGREKGVEQGKRSQVCAREMGPGRKLLPKCLEGCREPPSHLLKLPVYQRGAEGPRTGARQVQGQHRGPHCLLQALSSSEDLA